MNRDEELLFADEITVVREESREPWKVIIADDEEEVHAVTRMVLDSFKFEGRGLELLSAYSGKETKELLRKHPDTAVLLLDVVMEEDATGLEVVKYIRQELQNSFVRIILRTGQPGQAPERQVTMEYDINDYKEKTELTAQKLFTTIIGLLRAYRDLRMIGKSRKGLEQIAAISSSLFEQQSLKNFVAGLLSHLSTLLHFDQEGTLSPQNFGLVVTRKHGHYSILAATGWFKEFEGQPVQEIIPAENFKLITQAAEKKQSISLPNAYVGYFSTTNHSEHLIYIQSQYELNEIDKELLKVLDTNIAVAFENIDLNQAIIETQKEVIFTLGEIVEVRSQKSKVHIKRVAAYSHLLALKSGLGEETAGALRLASPLHDVGKLGIPDAILHKQGHLTDEERDIFKKHATIGYKILKGAKQSILKIAAQLALQHHERWDGQGYPQGLRGEQIHIFARITQIADIFDDLTSVGNVDIEHVRTFFKEQQGRQFDPKLVELFLEYLDEFLAIQASENLLGQATSGDISI